MSLSILLNFTKIIEYVVSPYESYDSRYYVA